MEVQYLSADLAAVYQEMDPDIKILLFTNEGDLLYVSDSPQDLNHYRSLISEAGNRFLDAVNPVTHTQENGGCFTILQNPIQYC